MLSRAVKGLFTSQMLVNTVATQSYISTFVYLYIQLFLNSIINKTQ